MKVCKHDRVLRCVDCENENFRSKVEEMQNALDFYGNADNWELPSFGRGHSAVVSDRGERARQTLKGIEFK